MKKYLTIKAVIEIDDDDNTINAFDDCLNDYDSIGRPIEGLKNEGWKVEFVSLFGKQVNIDHTEETITNIKYLRVRAGVRYWEDGYINDVKDNAWWPKMPFANIPSRDWVIDIDTETGIIKDWPQGVSARIHYKTCDDNTFYFINHDGDVISEYEGYVSSCLSIDDREYGDYIIFHIDENGKIENWNFTQEDIDEIKRNAF